MQKSEGFGNPLEITEIDKAWLAGVIEGDGSLMMGFHQQHDRKKNGKRSFAVKPTINFSNQDIKLIERVANLFHGLTGKQPRIRELPGSYEHSREVITLELAGMQSVCVVLDALIPYFVGDKLSKARLLQIFIKSRLGKFGPGIHGILPYDGDELVIIKRFYETTGPRKGGKRNPVIGEILREQMRDLGASWGRCAPACMETCRGWQK